MRISYLSGAFILYEVMIRITVVRILSGLITMSPLQLLDRLEYVNTVDQFKDTPRKGNWLEFAKRNSHRINSELELLMLQKKSAGSYQTVSQWEILGNILVSANHLPICNVFEFLSGGSIVIEIEDYSKIDIVSTIGNILQTTVGRK